MTLKASTGLRDYLAVSGSLYAALYRGFIDIYAGTVPSTADASIGSATKLCRISLSSSATGISFSTLSTSGALPKDPTEVWSGTNIAAGTASFFRFVKSTDDGTASTTQIRLQGGVATSASELIVASTTFTLSALTTIDSFSITIPTL